MTRTKGPMRWAGVFLLLSAALHILALVVSGFAGAPQLLIATVLYAALGFGVLNGMRWVAYIAFIIVFIGLSVAISGMWAADPMTGRAFTMIAAADVAALVCLFVALWRPAPTATA